CTRFPRNTTGIVRQKKIPMPILRGRLRMTMTRSQIGLLAGFTALAPLAIDMYLPAMPPLTADLGASVERAGQSIAVFLFGLAGGQLVAGPLSDRFGRKPLIVFGLALFAASAVVAAVTTSFAVLLASRLLQ